MLFSEYSFRVVIPLWCLALTSVTARFQPIHALHKLTADHRRLGLTSSASNDSQVLADSIIGNTPITLETFLEKGGIMDFPKGPEYFVPREKQDNTHTEFKQFLVEGQLSIPTRGMSLTITKRHWCSMVGTFFLKIFGLASLANNGKYKLELSLLTEEQHYVAYVDKEYSCIMFERTDAYQLPVDLVERENAKLIVRDEHGDSVLMDTKNEIISFGLKTISYDEITKVYRGENKVIFVTNDHDAPKTLVFEGKSTKDMPTILERMGANTETTKKIYGCCTKEFIKSDEFKDSNAAMTTDLIEMFTDEINLYDFSRAFHHAATTSAFINVDSHKELWGEKFPFDERVR